ncbi:hypothetical protein [Peribacillus frigoritolerans]|uniref:hypothetical protein n=1 Tax=Peribacillus frigoritolerans TaxID=450367 RepID=UPI0025A212D1|nr:hypothetical protein [Peribacillus frigoritolerans]MDM5313372.1 hypothetical protein [Peribacillus frigoritolerans]
MTNKVEMTKEMTAKITEVLDAKDAVVEHLEQVTQESGEINRQMNELQADVKAKTEAMAVIADIGELKLAKQEITALEEDMELLASVREVKYKVGLSELENKAEAFFKIHGTATSLFTTVDNYFLAHTSLSEFQESKKTMQDFASTLHFSFIEVKQLVIDEGLCEVENNGNLVKFKGVSLRNRNLSTELEVFENQCKLRKFVYESYHADKLSFMTL